MWQIIVFCAVVWALFQIPAHTAGILGIVIGVGAVVRLIWRLVFHRGVDWKEIYWTIIAIVASFAWAWLMFS